MTGQECLALNVPEFDEFIKECVHELTLYRDEIQKIDSVTSLKEHLTLTSNLFIKSGNILREIKDKVTRTTS